MKDKLWWWLVPVAILCGVAAGFYFWNRSVEEPAAVVPPPSVAAETPAVQHPVPAESADAALPSLEESDAPLLQALIGLLGKAPVDRLLVPTELVRHVVVTVDNLPRKKVAPQLLPVKAVPGAFVVTESGDSNTLDPKNSARYALWIKLIESADVPQLVHLYFRFYPLFQEVYQGLGYPNGYFNDRLVEVIDDGLATPEITQPIQLVQPGVMYQYADPELEARSAGQKVLLRVGNENAKIIKAKLRELRAAITSQKPEP